MFLQELFKDIIVDTGDGAIDLENEKISALMTTVKLLKEKSEGKQTVITKN